MKTRESTKLPFLQNSFLGNVFNILTPFNSHVNPGERISPPITTNRQRTSLKTLSLNFRPNFNLAHFCLSVVFRSVSPGLGTHNNIFSSSINYGLDSTFHLICLPLNPLDVTNGGGGCRREQKNKSSGNLLDKTACSLK